MNCATTNAVFVNEKLLFRNGINTSVFAPSKNVHKKGVFRFCVRFGFWGYACLGLGLSVCTKLFEIFCLVRFYFLGFGRFLGRCFLGDGCRFLL